MFMCITRVICTMSAMHSPAGPTGVERKGVGEAAAASGLSASAAEVTPSELKQLLSYPET